MRTRKRLCLTFTLAVFLAFSSLLLFRYVSPLLHGGVSVWTHSVPEGRILEGKDAGSPAAVSEKLLPGMTININTATAAQLTALPGIGEKLAAEIVDYRTANGPFLSIDGLLAVPGVGSARLSAISGYITVQ